MKRYLFIVSAIVYALSLIAGIVSLRLSTSSRAVAQQAPIIFDNETTSLEIVSARIEQHGHNVIRFNVKNIGDKPVVAYAVRFGGGFSSRVSTGDITSASLKPGETDKAPINIIAKDAQMEDGALRVKLVVCLFEDLSAEGDWNEAREQRERYEGMFLALKTGRAAMETLFDAPQFDSAAFEASLNEINQLSPPEGLSAMQKVGFLLAVQSMQDLIKDVTKNTPIGQYALEQSWQRFKEQTIRVKSFDKRMSSRPEINKERITR